MKNASLWHATQCGSCKNRRFGGTYRHDHRSGKISNRGAPLVVNWLGFRSVLRLLVTANVVHSLSILVTLMTEGIRSSETSVLT
jgi:hypothetical protein